MKKFIFIIIFGFILYINIKADCTISTACKNQQFPYELCSGGIETDMCTADPYSQAGYTPLKNKPCFKYDGNTYNLVRKKTVHNDVEQHYDPNASEDLDGNYHYGRYDGTTIYYPGTNTPITGYSDETGYHDYEYGDYIDVPYDTHDTYTTLDPCNEQISDGTGTIFNYDDVQTLVTNAQNEWGQICNGCTPNNDYLSGCCVHIQWTTNPYLISSDITKVPYTYGVTWVYKTSDCKWDCSKIIIYLNQTNEFTQPSSSDPCDYLYFFYTGSYTGNSSGNYYVCLRTTILHEMGHVLGFDEQYAPPGTSCATDRSIMNNTHLYEDIGLSDDDRCMYKKLYCPIITAVEEIKAMEVAIKIFPNPTNINSLNMQISNPFDYQMNYEIYSPIGISVISGNILPNENTKSINLEGLPTGVYLIILNYNNIKKIEKFVINK